MKFTHWQPLWLTLKTPRREQTAPFFSLAAAAIFKSYPHKVMSPCSAGPRGAVHLVDSSIPLTLSPEAPLVWDVHQGTRSLRSIQWDRERKTWFGTIMKKLLKTFQCVLNHLLALGANAINAFDTRPEKGQKYYITKQLSTSCWTWVSGVRTWFGGQQLSFNLISLQYSYGP